MMRFTFSLIGSNPIKDSESVSNTNLGNCKNVKSKVCEKIYLWNVYTKFTS